MITKVKNAAREYAESRTNSKYPPEDTSGWPSPCQIDDLAVLEPKEKDFIAGVKWLYKQIEDDFCGDESACEIFHFIECIMEDE